MTCTGSKRNNVDGNFVPGARCPVRELLVDPLLSRRARCALALCLNSQS